jgi:hypothetical protein
MKIFSISTSDFIPVLLMGTLVASFVGCFAEIAEAKGTQSQLSFSSSYELTSKALSTDLVWTIDPDLSNPHTQKWALSRKLELKGLKAIPKGGQKQNNQWGVTAEGVSSLVLSYVRPSGPWYRPWSEFSCEKEPNPWFDTAEGAKYGAAAAAKVWADLIQRELPQLNAFLDQISSPSEEAALAVADATFKSWTGQKGVKWKEKVAQEVRAEVWKYYLSEAKAFGTCPLTQGRVPQPRPPWSAMMEPLVGLSPPIKRLLARAPVRLWNGLFTIRADIKVGDRTLNGRFLIDSGARKSVMSPSWLEGQGIYQAWVDVPKGQPKRAVWSSQWQNEGGLAQPAWVDGMSIGGLSIPMNEFLLSETEIFDPPENAGFCCDGVLGVDFLRLFPIEFQTESPAEVRFWPRENFHWSEETPWIEVSESPDKSLVSDCTVSPDLKKSKMDLPGVVWLTGSETRLDIHSPWQKKVHYKHDTPWRVVCDGLELANQQHAQLPSVPGGLYHSEKVPAVSIGMPLLSRGNFTIDLGHGRLWFSKDALKKKERVNQTGLRLEYVMNKDEDRKLIVRSITKGSPAAKLEKEGLRPGSVITQFDEKEPQDIDFWEVEKRLAGEYGEWVTLQWRTKKGLKMAPLVVR